METMYKSTGEALRDLADALDDLKNDVIITARMELMGMMARLRILAIKEDTRTPRHPEDFSTTNVGTCDACGSRLVWRGRNPSVLRCPLECPETGP